LCNLDFREQACFYHSIKKCQGACIGQELPESYNERVEVVVQYLHRGLHGSFLVIDRGRHDAEYALIGVRAGAFCGYIYVEQTDLAQIDPPDLLNDLQPPGPDPDAARIIRGFLDSKKGVRTVSVKQ
jgi:DNA polymerase-3 subunit epsilon